jgi:hypothetical protein
MTRRRSSIPQRRPVFVGCEGESELGYAALLQHLLRDANLHVHLIVEDLGIGAGDPLSKVQMAIRKLAQLRRSWGAPNERFLLLDSDQNENIRGRVATAQGLAAQHRIQIVWQHPCFEAVLLRHLPNCATRRPPDTTEAMRALRREWADYEKPMARTDLSRKLGLTNVLQAAAVEPTLGSLLRCLGLIT